MKKIISLLVIFVMIFTMNSFRVSALIGIEGSGTKDDPYIPSTFTQLRDTIGSAPYYNMTGTPTYIRLEEDLEQQYSLLLQKGTNIDLDLNGHTVKSSSFTLNASKLHIYNGTIQSLDKFTGSYASASLVACEKAEFIADGVTFRGGSGMASGISGGYGLQIDNSTISIKNCTVISGNSYSDKNYKSAIVIDDSTGTISNTTLIRGAGMAYYSYKTLKIANSTITDGDGNLLSSSEIDVNEIYIPKAYADIPVTEAGGSKTFTAKGTYQAGAQADTAYSVDVAWGSMEFTYSGGSDGTWNPLTHEYENAQAAGWTSETGANKIIVTNRSNVPIDAGLSYTNAEGFDLTAAFTDSENTSITKLSLPTAEAYGETLSGPRSAASYMNITSGTLASDTAAKATLGTITVTISDAE